MNKKILNHAMKFRKVHAVIQYLHLHYALAKEASSGNSRSPMTAVRNVTRAEH